MKISVRDVQEEARSTHEFTSQSGDAEGSIHVRTTGSGSKVQGKVFTVLPYAVCLHEGTKDHTILPKKKKALRWSDGEQDGEQFVFAKRSQVSGIEKDPFIYNALEKERPAIVSRFKKLTATLSG